MALGIVFIRYQNHEEAKQCIEKANGKKLRVVGASESEELRAVFDGQGGQTQSNAERAGRSKEAGARREAEKGQGRHGSPDSFHINSEF